MGQVSQTAANHNKHRHPHADAQYRVYRLEDGKFGIEVTIPDALPTKVTSFPSRKAANQWVADHKDTVERQGGSAYRLTYVRRFANRTAGGARG